METRVGDLGFRVGNRVYIGLIWGYNIGIMENTMETTRI